MWHEQAEPSSCYCQNDFHFFFLAHSYLSAFLHEKGGRADLCGTNDQAAPSSFTFQDKRLDMVGGHTVLVSKQRYANTEGTLPVLMFFSSITIITSVLSIISKTKDWPVNKDTGIRSSTLKRKKSFVLMLLSNTTVLKG